MNTILKQMRQQAMVILLSISVALGANLTLFAYEMKMAVPGLVISTASQIWIGLILVSSLLFCLFFWSFWTLWMRLPKRLSATGLATLAELETAQEQVMGLTAQLEEERAYHHQRSNSFAAMSHELRSPLNGVIAVADLLRRTPLSEEQSKLVKIIQTSGASLLALINDLLDISKLENEALVLDETLFKGDEFLEEFLAVHRIEAEQKGLEFEVQMARGFDRHILADRYRVQQILQNILSNAIKFTEDGKISIEARLLPMPDGRGEMVFTIRDSGIGMSPAQQKNVFVPFAQADRTITRKYGGTGLGMPIARKLCEAMDGWIKLKSAPGQGTTFSFGVGIGLPSAAPEMQTPVPEAPVLEPRANPRLRNLSVLIAASSDTNRRVFELCLGPLEVKLDMTSVDHDLYDARFFGGYDVMLFDLSGDAERATQILEDIRRAEVKQNLDHMPIAAIVSEAGLIQGQHPDFDTTITLPLRATELYAFIDRFADPDEEAAPVQIQAAI